MMLQRSVALPAATQRRTAVVARATAKPGKVNHKIRLAEEKVVDFVPDSTQCAKQTVYCRCWLSDKWPLCDGKHAVHNKETGDNVGPLVVQNPNAK